MVRRPEPTLTGGRATARPSRRRAILPLAVLALASLIARDASAQAWKWVERDGRVSYGDRPPANGLSAVQVPLQTTVKSGLSTIDPTADSGLPFALRAPTGRHPVTLYSGPDCGQCEPVRAHLTQRGVPFDDRILRSDRDREAFARLGLPDSPLPVIAVGRESLSGYDALRLDRMLDVAGYPRVSVLPPRWRPPPPRALAVDEGAASVNRPPPARTDTERAAEPSPLSTLRQPSPETPIGGPPSARRTLPEPPPASSIRF